MRMISEVYTEEENIGNSRKKWEACTSIKEKKKKKKKELRLRGLHICRFKQIQTEKLFIS
jgi:hypothetical protein